MNKKENNVNELNLKIEKMEKLINSLQSKIEDLQTKNEANEKKENENKNDINTLKNRIIELENNEVNSLKYSILTKIRSKAIEDYLKLKLKNRSLKTEFLNIQYANEINQLLNANKILYFRKFANIILDEIGKKIGGNNIKKTDELYTNILNPDAKFRILYVEKDIEGIESQKITAIIDYFYFIKDECSNIIHLKKESFIKEDIYLNHLVMMENRRKESIPKILEINEKTNNINTKENKKNYSLNELCTYIFSKTYIDESKLIKDNIEKENSVSESFSLYSMKDNSSTNISNIEKNEKNIKDEINKIQIEKFYKNIDNEILFEELNNFISKNNDELINKKIGFNSDKIMLDLEYLQNKIKKFKQKIEENQKKVQKNEKIPQINSQYFFEEYKKSFLKENYRQFIHKFNIQNIKEILDRHFKFQERYLQLVKHKFETLEDIKNVVLKLVDGNKLVNIFDLDPGDFSKLDKFRYNEDEKEEKKKEKKKEFPDKPSSTFNFVNSKGVDNFKKKI